MGRPYTFVCPHCDHASKHDRALPIVTTLVFWHFFREHGRKSFRVGCPLFDDEPPEFDQ